MEKPYLEITQNNKSGLHGRCSGCAEYFTFGGPGLARDPEAAMRTMRRQFDKHVKQIHMCEEQTKLLQARKCSRLDMSERSAYS